MKILSLLSYVLIFSCSVSKYKTTTPNRFEKFAKIEGSSFIILSDTVQFKKKLTTLIDSSKHVSFDNIKVIEQQTLGFNKEDFYYVLAKDNSYNLKVARYLVREGNTLYLDNNDQIYGFEQTYLICVGVNDCDPQVFIKDRHYMWSCSVEDEGCKLESKSNCKVFTSFLFDE